MTVTVPRRRVVPVPEPPAGRRVTGPRGAGARHGDGVSPPPARGAGTALAPAGSGGSGPVRVRGLCPPRARQRVPPAPNRPDEHRHRGDAALGQGWHIHPYSPVTAPPLNPAAHKTAAAEEQGRTRYRGSEGWKERRPLITSILFLTRV